MHLSVQTQQQADPQQAEPVSMREGGSPADGKSSEDKADEVTTKDRKQNDSRGEKV